MAITKRQNKNKTVYQVQIYKKGMRVSSKTFTSKTLAKAWHQQERRRIEQTPDDQLNQENRRIMFKAVVLQYIEEHVSTLRHTSQKYILSICNRSLLQGSLSHLKLYEIGASEVSEWIQWLFSQRSSACQRYSFKSEILRLSSVFNWWRENYDSSFSSPILKRHRKKCRVKLRGREKEARKPDYFLKQEETASWLSELEKIQNPVYYRLAQFMLLTGVRVSEACGLVWDEVSFNEGFARIIRSAYWTSGRHQEVVLDRNKTESSKRIVVLPEKLVDVLRQMREEKPHSKLVFQGENEKILNYSSIRWAFDRSFKACGLSWRGTHICRHTYATMALMATHSLPAVQASLGHSDIAMTQRYAKIVALLSSDMAEKTARMYESKTNLVGLPKSTKVLVGES